MTTLQTVELGVLGPLQVRQYGLPVAIPGAKPRAILAMLGLYGGSVVSADTLVELLWGDDPPRTADKALQTHISSLRRALGDGFVLTEGTGWTLATTEIDASRYKLAAKMGRDAVAAGDTSQAVARFDEALTLWRGIPELPDGQRGTSEKTRWIEAHAALVEDRADALLATGRAAEIIGDLEAAVADAPLRERRWGQLMLALYRAGRQGEALGAYQRARSLLANELGVDPGPDLRRLEAAIVGQDDALEVPVSEQLSVVTRAVTFLLTDIEGSTAAWEADAAAMALALARHDEVVEQVVTSRGGRLIKTRGEGDATFSVFDRPSAAAAAAIELQEAIRHEPWALSEPMRVRVALHTGEVELRDGDYFGRAINRAARLRSLAAGGQILCSGATAELVIDTLSDDVILADLGMRQLRNLARPEHVFELRLETADDSRVATSDTPLERPGLPAVLAGPGPFVGRGPELERLLSAWQTTLGGGAHAVLIAGEPGVGKTRLAGEWSRHAHDQGAIVLYGRCDEDLGAPYQPFAEALRSLIPCLGTSRLRGLRGVEALLSLVPGLTDVLPDLATPTRADADTERYALFDAVIAVLDVASTSAPVVLIVDDLHWAAKPTLLLLRHLLRFGEHARVQIVGTYRSTDLDRSHPLAAMLADLHRDGSATRLQLSGLDEVDVSAYVAEAGYDDEELARALASVTGGNPFFLIEALRHVEESGGRWDPSTLPQGVREAVSRRLSRLPAETNKALAAAAVVGSRFAVELVERVLDDDLIDAFDEACKAGIVIEEAGGRYRFNHAIVRQSLLAELASVRRMRLHQSIAATLETDPGADDELLAELAYHYFECAWAGNAAKAVDYCRRAADQAMARLAYEGAADLYDHAVHALEEIDEELPDRDDQQAELLVARCEALLAAGDVVSAAGAVSQLQAATHDSPRLAAWGTCFDGQLSMLTDPERLDDIESAVAAAAERLAGLEDAAGEAKAHTVRAGCLARLGRIADAETALDHALTAARRAREHRRVNAVLANAPLAALWGPNPVPRAGGRCLDVVRLLRITTGSPVVEATSTRCQAVLDALRGRAAAGRSLLDSATRTLTELGMRHALLEVDQFAGILELVADDPAAAEPHLRRAYNGFRRMGLDADTAETAALLARACLALERDAEADELCTESERLAGHALKASIAWRTVRAQLLARSGAHDEARRVAEEAVAVAERTDLLVDHGDACLALATVQAIAGDRAGARAAAQEAIGLYELKGAAALAETARRTLGERDIPSAPAEPEGPTVELDNACVRAGERVLAAIHREAWDDVEQLFAPDIVAESHRKIVGFSQIDLPSGEWRRRHRRVLETGDVRGSQVVIAVRGERLALARVLTGTADVSPGAPQDEFLQLYGIDEEGRIALQVWFDIDDMDAAVAALEAAHARREERHPRAPLENAASRADHRFNGLFADRRWGDFGALLAEDIRVQDRRRGLRREGNDRATELAEVRTIADVGVKNMTSTVIAIRGERLALVRTLYSGRDQRPDAFHTEVLRIAEIGADERIVAYVAFDLDDFEAAIAELDARYLAGEAAAHAQTWSVITDGHAALNRRELPPVTPDCVSIDHRRGAAFAPDEMVAYLRAGIDLDQNIQTYVEVVHRLSELGAVCTHAGHGVSHEGFDAEWRGVDLLTVDGDMVSRCEVFDEADIDAAIAKFDQLSRPAQRLENAASQVFDRFLAHYQSPDWDVMAEMIRGDFSIDDRRRTVNGGVRHGRDAEIEDLRAAADVGFTNFTSTIIATRGGRLFLTLLRASSRDPEAIQADALQVVEIDAEERIAAIVVFDLDDFDAAFEELDARYLAGEAAPHAHVWQLAVDTLDELNRHEPGPLVRGTTYADHRRVPFAPGDFGRAIEDLWLLVPDASYRVTAVHALEAHGGVVSLVIDGTDVHGNELQWARICLISFGSGQARMDVYEEDDLDAALARFGELRPQERRLENAASRVYERFWTCLSARDWTAFAELMAADLTSDDRRRVVGAGVRHGRNAEIANLRAIADLGMTNVTVTVMATRGEHLILTRVRFTRSNQEPEAFVGEVLGVTEINGDDRIAAAVMFDLDDIDAAFEELDARYLAGEAADNSHMWSVIARAYAAHNRRELPATTPDWVNIDHRRGTTFAPGDLTASIRAIWDLAPDTRIYIEAVHRLSNLGALVTHAAHGTAQEGFEAEWRAIDLLTFEGDLISRCEIFDETDLDTALAKFEQVTRPTPRLENAASQVTERFWTHFAGRDWAALAEATADDISTEDRRRVVNVGTRHGRDADMANLRAMAELNGNATSTAIAIRGERLVLSRLLMLVEHDEGAEAFRAEGLGLTEINADNRVASRVVFDIDDVDAAIAELDARYLAGEAAPYSQTWSVVAGAYAALNLRELAATTPDWVNIDHRRGIAFAPGDMTTIMRAEWDLTPDICYRIEVVHQLSNLGAVYTHAAHGTSQEGFEAEWREINVLTVEGDLINRIEVFDEADIDVALARFDELSRPARQLENAASRVFERFEAHFAARDWTAMAEILAEDMCNDDRRRVVGAGVLRGRDTDIAHMQAIADVGAKTITSTFIATRGERLVLRRVLFSGEDQGSQAFRAEILGIVEIDADERIVARVSFDADDLDGAFEELDARYIAGEAAAHAQGWSLVAGAYAALNRHELPTTTPDWVNVDRRRVVATETGDMRTAIRAAWDLLPDLSMYVEAVHRLSNLGAVVTRVAAGTSREGFDAEWRMVDILTGEGTLINRFEIFEEADLDAALARFEELRLMPLLENAASQVNNRYDASFASRDWDAMAELLTEDTSTDDRRRVVNAGIRHGREAEITSMRGVADIGVTNAASVVIATRGQRLALLRTRFSGLDHGPEAFHLDIVDIVEIDADKRITARVAFDPNDIDAAFEELDARYLAGEAATHAHTWSVIAGTYAAFNRHGLVPDWVSVDNRRGSPFASSDLNETIRASRDLTPDLTIQIETVHRLSAFGAVVTNMSFGTSDAGFAAEWRMVQLLTVDGDRITRLEIFDEDDIDAALAGFDELSRPALRLENAASKVLARVWTHLAARDWTAIAEAMADDFSSHDRRRVVNAGVRRGRDVHIANMRAVAEVGFENLGSTVIATRGQRLALSRTRSAVHGLPEEVGAEAIMIVEIDADNRLVTNALFDLEDIDAAFEELDARYLAGEAAAHSHTWSVITRAYAALNRRELPATTSDWVNIDHRPGRGFAPGDLTAYLRASWDQSPDISTYIEAVHRLSNLEAVVTQVTNGTSREGFEAEWREVDLLTVEGDRINRCEMFDEADLDSALARFDELSRPVPQLENAASRMDDRLKASFAARDWAATQEILAKDTSNDDRRRVVGAGLLHGRELNIADLQAIADVGTKVVTSSVIATRRERLALSRYRFSGRDPRPEAFHADMLGVVEIDADNRIAARVWFDLDDVDAAFEELDARYLAGEAAAHAYTWSVIMGALATSNRHEVPPMTPDCVSIDHRRGIAFAPGDLVPYIRATWDVAPQTRTYFEAVHRLSDLGAVFVQVVKGTSPEGFNAEWREITLATVDGDRLNRVELFEEADLDAALARFDELDRPAPQLENVATRTWRHIVDACNRRDADGFLALTSADGELEDRRKGLHVSLEGSARRKAAQSLCRAPKSWRMEVEPIAVRGYRLGLTRERWRDTDEADRPITVETLTLTEVTGDELVHHTEVFDPGDIDEAFAALDARYLAGEAAAHSHTWSVISKAYAALNRRELAAVTSDWVNVDRRRLATIEAGHVAAYIRASGDAMPDRRIHVEAVHRLSSLGVVVSRTVNGTSQDGFYAEWREIDLLTVDGDLISRCEIFDETDLDAALARFDELDRSAPQLENAATQARTGLVDAFNRRDLDGFAALLTPDGRYEDRRKGLRDEGLMRRNIAQAVFDAPKSWRQELESVAIRGARLGLTRDKYRDTKEADRPITRDLLTLTEVGDDGLVRFTVLFDPDDIYGAMAELTARWIASGEVAHPEVIEVQLRVVEATNRHDWDAVTARCAGATYINHRQLGTGSTIADLISSLRMMVSLVPDLWVEPTEVPAHSAVGLVTYDVVKGTSTDGIPIEIPLVMLTLLEGDRVTRVEAFDPDQRDLALARFEELNRPT